MGLTETAWREHRRRVCLPSDSIYLNTGSYSPLPKPVYEEVGRLRREMAHEPSDFFWRKAPGLLNLARKRLASYLNAAEDRLLLLPNVTFAVNLAARSLPLSPGDEVLTTNQEYGAMRYCWQEIAQRRSLTVRIAELPLSPRSPEEIVSAIESQIGPATRVLFFSHVSSPTGLAFPAESLCRLSDRRGLVSVVDGAHAPGMIPTDLERIDADFYGANCHKWMMAPTGAGFLYLRAKHKRTLQPLITSWGWDMPEESLDENSGWGGSYWARKFEFHGTADRCAQMVLPAVLDFRESIGEEAIRERTKELAGFARSRLDEAGFETVTPEHPDLHGGLVAAAVPSLDVLKARDWMWNEKRIEAPFTQSAGRCFLRLSTAWFNLEEEIEQAVAALRQLPIRS